MTKLDINAPYNLNIKSNTTKHSQNPVTTKLLSYPVMIAHSSTTSALLKISACSAMAGLLMLGIIYILPMPAQTGAEQEASYMQTIYEQNQYNTEYAADNRGYETGSVAHMEELLRLENAENARVDAEWEQKQQRALSESTDGFGVDRTRAPSDSEDSADEKQPAFDNRHHYQRFSRRDSRFQDSHEELDYDVMCETLGDSCMPHLYPGSPTLPNMTAHMCANQFCSRPLRRHFDLKFDDPKAILKIANPSNTLFIVPGMPTNKNDLESLTLREQYRLLQSHYRANPHPVMAFTYGIRNLFLQARLDLEIRRIHATKALGYKVVDLPSTTQEDSFR